MGEEHFLFFKISCRQGLRHDLYGRWLALEAVAPFGNNSQHSWFVYNLAKWEIETFSILFSSSSTTTQSNSRRDKLSFILFLKQTNNNKQHHSLIRMVLSTVCVWRFSLNWTRTGNHTHTQRHWNHQQSLKRNCDDITPNWGFFSFFFREQQNKTKKKKKENGNFCFFFFLCRSALSLFFFVFDLRE